MKCISTHSLLYLQTAFSTNVETYIQYEHYNIHLPCSPEKTLHYLLELHQKSYARNIIGIHSSIHTTKIVFENGSTIEVNIPYTLVTKKWQESLTVGHIIEKTTFY